MTIKAIETRYAGCRFRSRLEARWAVLFDALGIEWDYEPEGFELETGTRYLPDFWLPQNEKWIEVKGNHDHADRSLDKCLKFAGHIFPGVKDFDERNGGLLGLAPLRVVSAIPKRVNQLGTIGCIGPFGTQMPQWLPPGQTTHLVFGLDKNDPDHCEEVPAGHVIWQWMPVEWVLADRESIIAAFNKARSARFEHGESG